ncbi:membrane protein [Ktedonobacter sp. SOSP1-52]|nr:membrane protein [Ktedonobacter sp. SOSP1-52]
MVLLVTAKHATVDAPQIIQAGSALTSELAQQAGVISATSYWTDEKTPTLRSRDGTQALVLARIGGNTTQARNRIGELIPFFTRENADMSVQVGGDDAVLYQSGTQSQQDITRAELFSFPILLVLLFLVFRSPIAAALPLTVGGLAIVGTLFVLRGIVSFTQVSNFSINLVTSLGLGIGVDYSLFIVSRFREEMRQGREVDDAILRTVETAGRMIAFSALTFGVALLALCISPNFFLRSFMYAGLSVIVVGSVCTLLTLPALLAVLGSNINRWSIGQARMVSTGDGFWHRTALFVMRRPVLISILVVTILLVLGLPVLRINFGIVDDRILPSSASSRQVQEHMRSHFLADEPHALRVVAETDISLSHRSEIEHYALALSRLPDVVQVDALTGSYAHGQRLTLPQRNVSVWATEHRTWFSVVPTQARVDKDAFNLVREVRALSAPFPVNVGGHIAVAFDLQTSVLGQAPVVGGLIILATLVILFLMTGSILLPLKATVLNILSLSATFGALVWIFQDGHLAQMLQFTATGSLEVRTVMLTCCIAFGLSMDYEVFIMGRIKEEYEKTGNTIISVATGLERSGPLVTAAAALLAVVFIALATSEIVLFKALGLGLAVAILMDATLIRALLVPACMRVMGEVNWWAPAWLRRVHLKIALSESEIRDDGARSRLEEEPHIKG